MSLESPKKIQNDVKEALKSIGRSQDFIWEVVPGDASNRSYARVKFADSSPSIVVMIMNAPEAFKSEEVTGSDETKIVELPFVTIAREMEKAKVRAPHIHFVAKDASFVLLEDLGDELLFIHQKEKGIADSIRWYEKALEELVKFQEMHSFSPMKDRRFTEELLSWEFEHFVEYALLKRNKVISDGVLSEIRKFGKKLVDRMLSSTYVPCHRDYHSKNLLILKNETRIGVIDFQDALMGPPTYDLASFLRDSYVRLSDTDEEHLLKYFSGRTGKAIDRELYGMTSLQRNLKAAGRFYYISMVKHKDTHLPFVKPTMLRIFKTLREIGELRMLSVLEGLMQEEVR